MKLPLLLLCTCLYYSVSAQKEITLDDAIHLIDKQVIITGRVLDARVLPTEDAPLFLKLGTAHSHPYLTVLILGDYKMRFTAVPRDAINKRVQVSGKVQLFNGKPMIVYASRTRFIRCLNKATARVFLKINCFYFLHYHCRFAL